MLVTAIEPLVLKVGDEVTIGVAREVRCRETSCEDDVVGVCSVAIGMELVELVVPAFTGLSDVRVPLLLSTVTLLAAHCPGYTQYCQVAQQIDPHNASPNTPSQIVDEAAADAVVEVCAIIKVAGAETGTEEDD